ncbi:MAG: zinc ribbon domain-containing protein [Methanoregula sp.]|jgi:TM2 domain-containing membrane protein YozV
MTRSCPACGAKVPEPAKFCSECGSPLAVIPAPPGSSAGPAQEKVEKSTALAVIGSAVFPGLGQVYEGNILRGYIVFLSTFFGFFLFILPGIAVWLYGVYDAYTTAVGMNRGSIPGKPAPVIHMVIFVIVTFLIAVLSVILLAVLFFSVAEPQTITMTLNNTGIDTPAGHIIGI